MRTLLAVLLTVTFATNAAAAVFKIGYGNAVATALTVKEDESVGGVSPDTILEDDVSTGQIMIGVELSEPLFGPVSLGIDAGIGLPAGEAEIQGTDAHVPAPGAPNRYEGDKSSMTMVTVPLLGKLTAAFPVGPGEIRAGLGIGAVLVSWTSHETDTKWGGNSNKTAVTDISTSIEMNTRAGTTALVMAQITPGYHLTIGENLTVGLDIPLSISSEEDVMMREVDAIVPTPGDDDPLRQGLTVGGFTWGVNVALTRRI